MAQKIPAIDHRVFVTSPMRAPLSRHAPQRRSA